MASPLLVGHPSRRHLPSTRDRPGRQLRMWQTIHLAGRRSAQMLGLSEQRHDDVAARRGRPQSVAQGCLSAFALRCRRGRGRADPGCLAAARGLHHARAHRRGVRGLQLRMEVGRGARASALHGPGAGIRGAGRWQARRGAHQDLRRLHSPGRPAGGRLHLVLWLALSLVQPQAWREILVASCRGLPRPRRCTLSDRAEGQARKATGDGGQETVPEGGRSESRCQRLRDEEYRPVARANPHREAVRQPTVLSRRRGRAHRARSEGRPVSRRGVRASRHRSQGYDLADGGRLAAAGAARRRAAARLRLPVAGR